MPLNVSREEIFTSYEHEVQKLRRLGKELRLKDIDIDEIIHHSFHLLQEQHMTENVKPSNDKIKKKSVRSYYSFQLIIKIIIIALLTLTVPCLFIGYHKPAYNLVVRNVQELIYPIMKCLRRITLPIVKALPSVTGTVNAHGDLLQCILGVGVVFNLLYMWKQIKVWYDEMCLIENPFFRATDLNCWACESVRSVLDLSDMNNPRDFQPHTGFPYVVKGTTAEVNYSTLEKMYESNRHLIDRDAYRISGTVPEWKSIAELMQYSLEENPTTNQDAHIEWRVNRLEPARLLRQLFPRPSFIPSTVNMERFILIDEPKAPQYKLPFPEGFRVFIMQGSGQRLLVLEPVEGCSINCTRVSVLLKPRDFLYYNSWFYRPKSTPVANSTTISVSYIGSL